ncbi:hypothetical protein BU23DRAFT_461741 [Bimuria novae-zelandiae CBS 107.79]|uniref:Altered inheritance of mitochondria protein 11 n=1 Tax=Bimuria novae-zelandiae CBS 107.79 TaxID=1447943 RepID=A0A6A5VH52_9PLEO|nr:hypothetical protein BU23DRAFT_461741 [Bimuria novae-zelandiae CBS 107.79]
MARSPAPPVNSPQRPPPESAYESTPITSARSLRQLSVFFFGATCFLASTALTRRAIYKRHLRVKPSFYAPNTNPHEHFSPVHEAVQALNLATMNCVSLGTMALGGTMWAFDIANLKEAQARLRGRLNYDTIYQPGEALPASIMDLLVASQETVAKEEEDGNSETPR